MSDVENSDDERYANESFENESDNEIPEMTEIESESTDNSDGDDNDLPSVKMNTGPIKRNTYPNRLSTTHNTDTVPFASSSDEEDDVVMGQTLAQINTPSMHFKEQSVIDTESPVRNLKSVLYESKELLNKLEEKHDSSDEISDEDEEREFQKIQDMEERYMQQNSAKLTKNMEIVEKESAIEDEQQILTADEDDSEEEETEIEQESESDYTNESQNYVNPLKNIKSHEENNLEETIKPETDGIDEILEINSNTKILFDQGNLMEIIQNSLEKLTTSTNTSENDILMTSQMLQPTSIMDDTTTMLTFNSNSAAILNTQSTAMAVVNALKATSLPNTESISNNAENEHEKETSQLKNIENQNGNNDTKNNSDQLKNYASGNGEETKIEAAEHEMGNEEDQVYELDYDDNRDVYYNSHFDYRITSKTPSSFNSDDYIFHANFIKPFHRTKSNDKLRVKPHQRKSMTFTNERMREIERHNQILLRKILTQKPTYTAKNKSTTATVQKLPSQTNLRPSTSAVNRKKQQRQIDLDNQILKRKIEAISLRRRPLIS